MYSITPTTYGFKLIFSGMMDVHEMTEWYNSSVRELRAAKKNFCVLVDMHSLSPLNKDAKEVLEKGQMLYAKQGMLRSSVLLPSQIMNMQIKNTAKSSGILPNERVFMCSDPECEKKAMLWIEKGVE